MRAEAPGVWQCLPSQTQGLAQGPYVAIELGSTAGLPGGPVTRDIQCLGEMLGAGGLGGTPTS